MIIESRIPSPKPQAGQLFLTWDMELGIWDLSVDGLAATIAEACGCVSLHSAAG